MDVCYQFMWCWGLSSGVLMLGKFYPNRLRCDELENEVGRGIIYATTCTSTLALLRDAQVL